MTDAFLAKLDHASVPEVESALIGESYRHILSIHAQSDISAREGGAKQVYVLLEGWACQYRLLTDGRRQILRIHLPGEVCDVDKIACDDAGCGLLALTDCRVATIPLDIICKMVDERPAVRTYFMRLLTLERAALAEQVVSLGRRSARERVAYFLCDLLRRLQMLDLALDNSFRLPLTQVDIGDHLGLSTVHVNRTLQDLKSERLVQSGGRRSKICNRDALERLARFQRSTTDQALKAHPFRAAQSPRMFADARH